MIRTMFRAALAAVLAFVLAAPAFGQAPDGSISNPRVLDAGTIVRALGYTPGRGSWFEGTGAPVSGFATNGDFYFRADTAQIYQKSAGAWSVLASLVSLAGNNTFTGAQSWKGFSETYSAPAISSNTLTIDLSQGTFFNVASNANILTFAVTNAPAGKASSFTVFFTGNGTAYTQNWGSVKWPGGVAPALSSDNGKVDAIAFVTNDGGATWFGFIAGQYF